MKKFKKLASLVMAAMMALMVSVTANAEGEEVLVAGRVAPPTIVRYQRHDLSTMEHRLSQFTQSDFTRR